MRHNYDKKPCISAAREVKPDTKSVEAQVEEEKETWSFGPTRQQRRKGGALALGH